MDKRLIIIGASGHGKVVADIAERNGYQNIIFLDDDVTVKNCGKYSVVGNSQDASHMEGDVIVAIGNVKSRKRISEQYQNRLVTLVHPDAIIADNVKLGAGTVIMAGTVINADAVIGNGCIVNTGSSIDHDCMIGDYVHVAVGAHLCGMVTIESDTWIGAGAVISNNISVCSNCMIGAGAVVVKDIKESGTYVGCPVRGVKSKMKSEMANVCSRGG
ncbi:MAG: acetyltransferase [Bacteroides sp.]|nr:acetyltransferase [Bacteroides sp.]